MTRKNVFLGFGIMLFIAIIGVSISLFFQRGLTTLGILLIIGSALLGSAAIISGVRDSIELVERFSSNDKGKAMLFSITSPKSGEAFQTESIIEANGTHSLDQDSFVWSVLTDKYKNYYLQNPPVVLFSGENWRATNLHLGRDIIEIIFVKVTSDGNDVFLKKVKNNHWGAFSSLPVGTETLESVRINVG